MTERSAWIGPKEGLPKPSIALQSYVASRYANAPSIESGAYKEMSAIFDALAAFEPLEPKGLSKKELEFLIPSQPASAAFRQAAEIALRLSTELSAVTAQLAALQKAHAEAGAEYVKMQRRAQNRNMSEITGLNA